MIILCILLAACTFMVRADDLTAITTPSNYKRGIALYEQKQYLQAAAHLHKAVIEEQNDIHALFHIGSVLGSLGSLELATTIFAAIYAANPHIEPAQYNHAYMLKTAGKFTDAIAIYKDMVQTHPNHDQAHLGLAFSYLMSGDYENGWREHIWNLKHQGKDSEELRIFLRTNTVAGKIIYITPEGGLGDTLNFIRYAWELKKLGATVMVRVQQPLIPLLSLCPYIDTLVTQDQTLSYHARITTMSLPALFGNNGSEIPATIPYLFANPALIEHWKTKLSAHTEFKIGISWQADVFNDSSRMPIAHRGIPLALLEPLTAIPGVRVYSLQKIDGLDQLNNLQPGTVIETFENLDTQHGPFMDTAAIMHQMDLIITIDSATAHLAGALGRPTVLMLPYVTDWRWLWNSSTTPWYPTMHIFKQPAPFDWQTVADAVHAYVRTMAHNHRIAK